MEVFQPICKILNNGLFLLKSVALIMLYYIYISNLRKGGFKIAFMNDNKEKILKCAIKIITKKGIDRTTLKEIASEAKISKGTLFYYYPSKAEIMYDILELHILEADSIFQQVIEKSAILTESDIEICFNKLLLNQVVMKINFYLVVEGFIGDKIIEEKLKKQYHVWRNQFIKLVFQQRKEMQEVEAKTLGVVLLAAIDGVCLQYLLDPSEVNIHELSKTLARIIKI